MKQLPGFRVFRPKLISFLFEWHGLLGFSPGLQALVNEIQLVLHAAVLHLSRTDLASHDAPPPPTTPRAPWKRSVKSRKAAACLYFGKVEGTISSDSQSADTAGQCGSDERKI